MGRKRSSGQRTRAPSGPRQPSLTVESQIEGFGRFVRGVKASRPGTAARMLGLVALALVSVTLVTWVVYVFL